MFNSTVLDVAVGLVFTFLAVSLAVSAITEGVSSILGWRSQTLLQGVKDLLNDQAFTGIALNLYNHAMVAPRDAGTAQKESDLKHLPTYIEPAHFADALIDVVGITKDAPPANLKSTIQENVSNPQLQFLLKGVVDRTAGDLTAMRNQIGNWFDSSMDRVGGAYKRKTQVWSFFIALILAAGLNVSSVDVGKALWLQPLFARTIAPTSELSPVEALQKLQELDVPIGWTQTKVHDLATLNGLETVMGWLITAVATLFGAPFWFDTLERVVRLKGSGPSPAEKRSGMGAAA
jgi:hypothetical protein